MRKVLAILCVLFSTSALAQSVSTQVISRIRDATDPNAQAKVERPSADNKQPAGVYALDVLGFGMCYDGATWDRITCALASDTISPTTQGQTVIALNHFVNGTSGNFERWYGATVSSDNLPTTLTAPNVRNFGMCYDTTGGNWDRDTCITPVSKDTSANAQGNPIYTVVSKNTSVNSVSNPIICQVSNGTAANAQATPIYAAVSKDTSANAQGNPIYAAVSKDTSANAQGNPLYAAISKDTSANAQGNPIYAAVSKDTSANAVGNPLFCQLSDGSNAFMTSTSYPGYQRVQDGDGTTLADVSTLTTDGIASNNGLVSNNRLLGYNGSTWDRLRVGGSYELKVTDIAVRPGEDSGNNWREVKKSSTAVYAPAKETSGQILAVPVIVLAAKEILGYPNCCIYLKNNDASVSLTDVDLQVSPDNSSWVDLTEPASCDTLAAGTLCTTCFSNNAYRYVRLRVTAAAVASDVDTVDTWITCNAN